jgi:glutamyl-tRNA synthetase
MKTSLGKMALKYLLNELFSGILSRSAEQIDRKAGCGEASTRNIKMEFDALAQLLFPDIQETITELEARFPQRNLPPQAKVTRFAPSPTGFLHLGNLYGALIDERLAHTTEGCFYLRIEDTDQKREVPQGVEKILNMFEQYSMRSDEGATTQGDKGAYGPYRQRARAGIYQVCAKWLVTQGSAYPCFCTEEELQNLHSKQEATKENFGYYGAYAKCRDLTLSDIEANLKAGIPFVLRFRSQGEAEKRVKFTDLVHGQMEFPENSQDVVLLKSDGVPTYHFAHVVDDHFMRTTHVVRGEEWLATLPIHLQLFGAMGWKCPKYVHTAHLMKQEGTGKRKLSKRKDPELGLEFYRETGVAPQALKEYLLGLINSNFEEWRQAHGTEPLENFPFSVNKLSVSGALFDIVKLADVSKNVLALMPIEAFEHSLIAWAQEFDPLFFSALTKDLEYTRKVLSVGRDGNKTRKDLAFWNQAKEYYGYYFDELFTPSIEQLDRVDPSLGIRALRSYAESYAWEDTRDEWFDKVKALTLRLGYADNVKAYKQNPENFGGHVGDISNCIRLAITGRTQSPDLWEIMQVLGQQQVNERLLSQAKRLEDQ